MCLGKNGCLKHSALTSINLFQRRTLVSGTLWGTLCDSRLPKSLASKSLPHAGCPFGLQPSHSDRELKPETALGLLGEKPLQGAPWLQKFSGLYKAEAQACFRVVSTCPPPLPNADTQGWWWLRCGVSRALVESLLHLGTTSTICWVKGHSTI